MTQNDPLPKDKRQPASARMNQRVFWRPLIWGITAVVAIVVGWRLIQTVAAPDSQLASQVTATPTLPPLATEMPARISTPDPPFVSALAEEPTATATTSPAAVPRPAEPPVMPTLAAGEVLVRVTPAAGQVGWVGSQEARGNHFGDSFLHAGTVQGQVFHSAIQLDLSRVARGAPIRYAAMQLTGIDDNRLDRNANSAWSLRWLDPEINKAWSSKSFQDIHNAAVFQSLLPSLGQADLAPLGTNQFVFNPEQLRLLQQALVDVQAEIAFRLDGPEVGGDDLFTWDSGYGPATQGSSPVLLVVVGPAPATPPPIPTQDYIVVTSTPTPANVLTAAAIVIQNTAQAIKVGTPTLTPRSMVTATPSPENEQTAEAQRLLAGLLLVVTPTPLPANQATAAAISAYATAMAVTTGTFTPFPTDYVTATPTPLLTVVTNTPTAASVFQLLDRVAAEATRTATAGPPTPFPPGVVTATPTSTGTPLPLNAETAQARVILITIEALTTGTWTPTPTLTPTPTVTRLPGAAPPSTPILPPLPPVEITLVEGAPQAEVLSDRINVRAGPGTQYAVVSILPVGSRLSLLGRNEASSWLAVCCVNGQTVWIAQFLVRPDADINGLPIQAAPTSLQ